MTITIMYINNLNVLFEKFIFCCLSVIIVNVVIDTIIVNNMVLEYYQNSSQLAVGTAYYIHTIYDKCKMA